MRKKIAIFGSTGSIGRNLLKIIESNKKDFKIELLSANKNYKELLKQVKKFNVKNIIVNDDKAFDILKEKERKLKINVFKDYSNLSKIFKKKIDYVMSAVVGLQGLYPTLKSIKYTKKIAIANKESLICGWNLIKKELTKHKTEFMPVDSEHFSIWFGLHNLQLSRVEKVYLTASGGPFYKLPLSNFNKITIKQALQHPNWSMGKKISVDSATMINKVYEVIEAKNIFNLSYKKIKILIHPNSYIHALIKFNNGLIKLIAHDTTMKIPIFNSLFFKSLKNINSSSIDMEKLNNLNLSEVSLKRYPIVKILNLLPNKISLYETVIVSANDFLVELFLNKKIKFNEISKNLLKIIKTDDFIKLKRKTPKNIEEIMKLSDYVRLKIFKNIYKSKNVSFN
ncbi:1-deoxy-D-xylulose-5-phosphate reductoisomerase [Candidatus Pelagibacter sp.]|uniref:1-deoxy-D-xylulose-5-phosphate reductoisomerase n=1 Tax=Candidatus Pelagibacter sp. TaxID=2024849 RepID=UPI003F8525C8